MEFSEDGFYDFFNGVGEKGESKSFKILERDLTCRHSKKKMHTCCMIPHWTVYSSAGKTFKVVESCPASFEPRDRKTVDFSRGFLHSGDAPFQSVSQVPFSLPCPEGGERELLGTQVCCDAGKGMKMGIPRNWASLSSPLPL